MEGELRRFSHPTRETTVEGRLDRPESPLLTGDDEGKKEDRVSSSCSLELKARLFFFMATFISAALSGLSLLQDEMQVQGLAVGVGPHAGEAALDQDLLKWERPILSSFFFFF